MPLSLWLAFLFSGSIALAEPAEKIGAEVTYRHYHSLNNPLPIIIEVWGNESPAADEMRLELKLPKTGVTLKSDQSTVKIRGPINPGKRIRHAFVVVPPRRAPIR